jgi:hypothetical protein
MAWLRFGMVGLGPDPDGDAYGHHVIARELLKDPMQHGKHWVWLPLFHWLQLPLLSWGGRLDTVRYINVGLWTLLPSLFLAYLLRDALPKRWGGSEAKPDLGSLVAATVAGVLLALTPLGMQMGTTAQPEPLFALLVLMFIWSAQWQKYGRAAAFLTFAVLLRYEAWSILAFSGAAVAFDQLRRMRREGRLRVEWAPVAMIAIPGAAILGWALLRLPHDHGRFMWFVRGTHDFAQEALLTRNSFQQGLGVLAFDLMRYVFVVPHRTYGIVTLLAALGVWRLWQRHFWLSLASFAVLAFITFGWLMRSTLGLERHFVSVLPWYAALISTGMVCGVELLQHAWRRIAPGAALSYALLGTGTAALVAVTTMCTVPWLRDWKYAIEHTFADQLEIAQFVDSLPKSKPVFVDEPTVEALTHLWYEDVERGNVDWPPVRDKIHNAASAPGGTYVVSWLGKLGRLPDQGEIIFRPSATRDKVADHEGHPDKTQGLAVMHVELTPAQISRH